MTQQLWTLAVCLVGFSLFFQRSVVARALRRIAAVVALLGFVPLLVARLELPGSIRPGIAIEPVVLWITGALVSLSAYGVLRIRKALSPKRPKDPWEELFRRRGGKTRVDLPTGRIQRGIPLDPGGLL